MFAFLLLLCGVSLTGRSLGLPPRPSTAQSGSEFARSIRDLPLAERERRIIAEIKSGNVPAFLRQLVPVTAERQGLRATYFVTPDYLAIGSNDDYFLTPLSPRTAQAIADRLDCVLPTPRMVDQIYAQADVKLKPRPIPPSPAMTTVAVFLRHNELIRAERGNQPLGVLVSGHKKDVVIANKLFKTRGKVAIYGWHKLDGKPIQPLYTGHSENWVDYSHGIRLVNRRMLVSGEATTIEQVLADPNRAALLSSEGAMLKTRYDLAETASSLQAAPGTKLESLSVDPGVRIVIDRPDPVRDKPVLLIDYALPNGGTIEQAIGKARKPGDDWHFDIQHVGAQLGWLRQTMTDRSLVVAYLESDLRSWPAWRGKHGDRQIPAILNAVRRRSPDRHTRIVLSAHSGGGSLIFGYLNTLAAIPDDIERIAFLDANYAYETDRHQDKLVGWLKSSNQHFLTVLAYNDAAALLYGKPFVSASGGTWGRSHQLLHDLETPMPFARKTMDQLERSTALQGRVTFLLLDNPERKILHTVLVERNGFIESLLAGTPREGVGYSYMGDRAYTRFILGD
ncbi:MAG: hypothetical protein ACP5XB_25195 [Isosphaeraceae bacterium]